MGEIGGLIFRKHKQYGIHIPNGLAKYHPCYRVSAACFFIY